MGKPCQPTVRFLPPLRKDIVDGPGSPPWWRRPRDRDARRTASGARRGGEGEHRGRESALLRAEQTAATSSPGDPPSLASDTRNPQRLMPTPWPALRTYAAPENGRRQRRISALRGRRLQPPRLHRSPAGRKGRDRRRFPPPRPTHHATTAGWSGTTGSCGMATGDSRMTPLERSTEARTSPPDFNRPPTEAPRRVSTGQLTTGTSDHGRRRRSWSA